MEKTELQTVSATGFDRFIELALNKQVPVETLERLLAMQKEIMAANAKAAYDEAMRAFQKACPIIQKHKRVMNKDGHSVRYVYAPLDDIIEQVKIPLADHGFSYRLGQAVDQPKPGWLTVFCTATHALGHSETEKFELPLGAAQFMTAQQEVGAARTFGSRYCFLGVFGIMTGDEDTDANPAQEEKPAPGPQAQTTPSAAKPNTPSAPQPPAPTPSGSFTVTGTVIDMVTNPKPAKSGAHKTKIVLENKISYYTFDTKIVELVNDKAATGPATITGHVGKFGNDIDTLTFGPVAPPIEQYAGELEKKPNG